MLKEEIVDFDKYYRIALALALFTIFYNIIEGVVSTYFGYNDESLALFGFGSDSFIEVISGLGIAHMIYRIKINPTMEKDNFERTALHITGYSFYALVIGLVLTSAYNIFTKQKPETTFWGIIISVISIAVMWGLIILKIKTGKKLNSNAIIADAQCTKVCIYMSVVLLLSSILYEASNIYYIDSIGSIAISYLAFKEGQECFLKAKGCTCSCCHVG